MAVSDKYRTKTAGDRTGCLIYNMSQSSQAMLSTKVTLKAYCIQYSNKYF